MKSHPSYPFYKWHFLLILLFSFGFEKNKVFAKDQINFIANHEQLVPYHHNENVVMIASPGRSGSTMFTLLMKKFAKDYTVLKTHLLPPDEQFTGKIIFIFSYPDKAAESACRLILKTSGKVHFSHVESADQSWFDKIGRNGRHQNEKFNLLASDALGCETQLKKWLLENYIPCNVEEAQVLAIKLENLWEPSTLEACKAFLQIKKLKLPSEKERGCKLENLSKAEFKFRSLYNEGTKDKPIYRAYDNARKIWTEAPPFQFLKSATSLIL